MTRFINRINTSSIQSLNVYNDPQNIHNSMIQETIRNSINCLTTRNDLPKYNTDILITCILENKIFTEQTKTLLINYIQDVSIHSLLLLTFSEILWFYPTASSTEVDAYVACFL